MAKPDDDDITKDFPLPEDDFEDFTDFDSDEFEEEPKPAVDHGGGQEDG